MKKIKLNKRDVVVLIVVACIVVAAFARYVIYENIQDFKFANQMENIYAKNEKAVFAIDKIVLYSSANATDNSEGQTMQDMNVCQFTDMAIYIDNTSYIEQLTPENTVKELYIDNIKINAATNKGRQYLTYKNPLSFGKFRTITQTNNTMNENLENQEQLNNGGETQDNTVIRAEDNSQTNASLNGTNQENGVENIDNNYNALEQIEEEQQEQQERIDFEILYTNEDNEKSDYTNPTFYTDCSNPITLDYMNKNIVTGYAVSTQDTQITFDGKILQSVGVNLDDIACVVDFDIHLKNNLDQDFVCSVGVNIPLKNQNRSIYSGYMYGMENELQKTYAFFKK